MGFSSGHHCKDHISGTSYAEKRRTMLEVASKLGLRAEDIVELVLTRISSADEDSEASVHMNTLITLLLPSFQRDQTEIPILQQAFFAQQGVASVLKAIRKGFSDISFDFGSPDASGLSGEGCSIDF